MRKKASHRYEHRLLSISVGAALVLLVAGALLSIQTERSYRSRTLEQVDVQAQILAASVSAALTFDDTDATREYVDALAANPEVAAAGVYDEVDRMVVSFHRPGAAPPPEHVGKSRAVYLDGSAVVVAPVRQRSQRLGAVYLRTVPEPWLHLFGRHSSLAALIAMALFAVALLSRATVELQKRADALAQANSHLKIEMEEREKAEVALRQSQKMEALGQLTGGVAHDFNNLLTVIIGGLETIGRQLPKLPETADMARLLRAREMAIHGAERAAVLTNRLLAFSRRQPLEPNTVDANKMVLGMAELMRRTLGETITLETVLAAGLWRTKADHNQLENAVLNLAVNARDAMPEGGKLTIETSNVFLDDAYVDGLAEAIVAGQYVMIGVTDAGCGMEPETLAKVFEPFFTTKDVGKGTGLGLSQVYGFVRQTGGYVRVYSEPGQGTTVKIYLPRLITDEETSEDAPVRLSPNALMGDEAILLVEDHDDLRAYSSNILRELGYKVMDAADGEKALAILDSDAPFSMLFTDVVLPGGMNGRQLADEVLRRRPGLKVLFTTGYTRNAIVHNGMLDPGVQLITKPFTFDQLALKVRRILDSA